MGGANPNTATHLCVCCVSERFQVQAVNLDQSSQNLDSTMAAVLVVTIRGQGCISHNDRQGLGDSVLPPT